ncbi:hypothetical protein BV20DRAFT_312644 [Pilatotrama ljubarskyi]|nr:hypothetical protein BV20DRAFT_312644 [Pilatotrama ljubarskyi]
MWVRLCMATYATCMRFADSRERTRSHDSTPCILPHATIRRKPTWTCHGCVRNSPRVRGCADATGDGHMRCDFHIHLSAGICTQHQLHVFRRARTRCACLPLPGVNISIQVYLQTYTVNVARSKTRSSELHHAHSEYRAMETRLRDLDSVITVSALLPADQMPP